MIVYKITNKITQKCYIGITTQPLMTRWEGHLSRMRIGDTRHLYQSMRKYGIKNFSIEQIDTANTVGELLEKEKHYVKLYNSRDDGYNMTDGGDVNPMEDLEVLEKHNSKMRSPEVRAKISETMKRKAKEGKLFSEEHRRNLRKAAKNQVYLYYDSNKSVIHLSKDKTKKIEELLNSGWKIVTKDKNICPKLKNYATRSVGCYCILEDGSRYDFDSYLDAGKWWYENYKPFGDTYSSATYQRKIKKSIKGETVKYSQSTKKDYKVITNIKWYKKEVVL